MVGLPSGKPKKHCFPATTAEMADVSSENPFAPLFCRSVVEKITVLVPLISLRYCPLLSGQLCAPSRRSAFFAYDCAKERLQEQHIEEAVLGLHVAFPHFSGDGMETRITYSAVNTFTCFVRHKF